MDGCDIGSACGRFDWIHIPLPPCPNSCLRPGLLVLRDAAFRLLLLLPLQTFGLLSFYEDGRRRKSVWGRRDLCSPISSIRRLPRLNQPGHLPAPHQTRFLDKSSARFRLRLFVDQLQHHNECRAPLRRSLFPLVRFPNRTPRQSFQRRRMLFPLALRRRPSSLGARPLARSLHT